MHTSGDEMELLAAVNRRFRHIFAKQEHMKAFRVYDIAEVNTFQVQIGHQLSKNWDLYRKSIKI